MKYEGCHTFMSSTKAGKAAMAMKVRKATTKNSSAALEYTLFLHKHRTLAFP